MSKLRRSDRSRTRARILGFAISLVAFAALASGAAADYNYVGLGDSFTAGPLIPQLDVSHAPAGCLQSDSNYVHLVGGALGLEFRDASCSGAQTRHMTQPQGVTPGPNPPQFDRLDGDTVLVTLGIAGNDIGFSEIVRNCVTLNPFDDRCLRRYVVGGVDEISNRIANVASRVADTIQGIHERSPSAGVFVVNYEPFWAETGVGCWPLLPIGSRDVPYLRAKEQELNAMLADQAAANDATLVDAYTAGIGHDACRTPPVRWVEPLIPGNPAAPFHPNASGMAGAAQAVIDALG